MEMQGLIRELLGRVHVVCVIVITFTVFVGMFLFIPDVIGCSGIPTASSSLLFFGCIGRGEVVNVYMYFVVKTEKRVCSRIIWFLEFVRKSRSRSCSVCLGPRLRSER